VHYTFFAIKNLHLVLSLVILVFHVTCHLRFLHVQTVCSTVLIRVGALDFEYSVFEYWYLDAFSILFVTRARVCQVYFTLNHLFQSTKFQSNHLPQSIIHPTLLATQSQLHTIKLSELLAATQPYPFVPMCTESKLFPSSCDSILSFESTKFPRARREKVKISFSEKALSRQALRRTTPILLAAAFTLLLN
jgi:hypothetical protein